MATTRKSRVFTISLPAEMARKAETIATTENFTMSELFRQAFRAYFGTRIQAALEEASKYAATVNPHGYAEEDIPCLVQEVRAEMRAEELAKEDAGKALATQ